jgi:type IV secretion system protein VirB8
MDLKAERVLLGRSALVAAWVVGGTGVACVVASSIVVASLFPLKRTEAEFFIADQSSGIISKPISVDDAPKAFTPVNDQYYLRRYIEAREGWVWETDQSRDHLVKLMSTPDEQARIEADRKKPTAVGRRLGKDGHVVVENFRWHQQPAGRLGTRTYIVQFDSTVWHGSNPDRTEVWTATADFQWHPELPMKPDDRTNNAGGMQVLAYSAASTNPDQTRQ